MPTKEKIIAELKRLKPHYAKEGLIIEGLFGSYARGEATEESDIDVLIEIDKGIGDIYTKKKNMRQALEALFHTKVDLARRKYLTPLAQETISSDVIQL